MLPLAATRMYSLALAELALQPDDELLDVGCGAGVLLARARSARYVAGLDASQIQIGLARRRLADRLRAGTAELVVADARKLPWSEGRFSAAVCVNALQFVPDPERALRELVRVLHPGGRALVIIDPPPQHPAASGTRDAIGEWRWSAADAQGLMAGAGFSDVEVTQAMASHLRVQLLRGVKAPAAAAHRQTTRAR